MMLSNTCSDNKMQDPPCSISNGQAREAQPLSCIETDNVCQLFREVTSITTPFPPPPVSKTHPRFLDLMPVIPVVTSLSSGPVVSDLLGYDEAGSCLFLVLIHLEDSYFPIFGKFSEFPKKALRAGRVLKKCVSLLSGFNH